MRSSKAIDVGVGVCVGVMRVGSEVVDAEDEGWRLSLSLLLSPEPSRIRR